MRIPRQTFRQAIKFSLQRNRKIGFNSQCNEIFVTNWWTVQSVIFVCPLVSKLNRPSGEQFNHQQKLDIEKKKSQTHTNEIKQQRKPRLHHKRVTGDWDESCATRTFPQVVTGSSTRDRLPDAARRNLAALCHRKTNPPSASERAERVIFTVEPKITPSAPGRGNSRARKNSSPKIAIDAKTSLISSSLHITGIIVNNI